MRRRRKGPLDQIRGEPRANCIRKICDRKQGNSTVWPAATKAEAAPDYMNSSRAKSPS